MKNYMTPLLLAGLITACPAIASNNAPDGFDGKGHTPSRPVFASLKAEHDALRGTTVEAINKSLQADLLHAERCPLFPRLLGTSECKEARANMLEAFDRAVESKRIFRDFEYRNPDFPRATGAPPWPSL